MVGVAGVIGLCGGVAEIGGRPGLMLTGAATPGTKTFAFGLSTNSFALGFRLDFFAAAAADMGVEAPLKLAGGEDEEVLADGDMSCSVSDFCLWKLPDGDGAMPGCCCCGGETDCLCSAETMGGDPPDKGGDLPREPALTCCGSCCCDSFGLV